MTKSAIRALQLLELLAEGGRPLSHAEICDALAVPKSSLTDLLAAMMARHYISRAGDTGERFTLGPGVLPLAGALLRQTDIVVLAQPVLASLVLKTGESAALVVRSSDEALVIARVASHHPVAYAVQIGNRAPLYATAAGKALLAATPDPERERYLKSHPLKALTVHTITDRDILRQQLNAIAAGAVAIGREELFEGVVTLALAVHDANGHAVASLSIGMPVMRFNSDKQRLVEDILRQAASDVSTSLGCRQAAKKSGPIKSVAESEPL